MSELAHEITAAELHRRLRRLEERIDAMPTQADIDTLTSQVQAVDQHVTDAQAALQSELDALEAQIATGAAASELDLSGLQAAVAKLDPAVQALAELKPSSGSSDAPAEPAAPSAPDAPAPVAPDQPASPAPAAPSGPTDAGELPRTPYTFSGDPSQIDPGAWPASGFETAEATPRPLYYFAGDSQQGQQNGNGLSGGAWQAYTGPVQPAAAAASS